MAEPVKRLETTSVTWLDRAPLRLTVTMEAVLYVGLAALALVTRLADVHTIPLSGSEAREALAAWHLVHPGAPGTAPLATSPLMFVFNSIAMALGGASEFTARFFTILAGVALVLSPVLWRDVLGRVGALATSCLLAVSTTVFVATRTMSPVIWSGLLFVVALRLFVEDLKHERPRAGVAAILFTVAAVLLADPAGFVWLAGIGIAWGVVLWLSADDAPGDLPAPRVRRALVAIPWVQTLVAAGVLVVLVSTLLMAFPSGLSQVGALLERGLEGVFRRPAGHPFAFPVVAVLLYDPAIWLIALLGIRAMQQQEDRVDQFLVGWALGGLVTGLLYAGAGPEHGLWLSLPLAGLGGRVIARLLQPVRDPLWRVPDWAVPALTSGFVALLFIASTNFIWVARALYSSVPGMAPNVQPLRLVLTVMSLMLFGILFFLGASLWGAKSTTRSTWLALALFLGFYTASTAWRVGVTHVDNPTELWHVSAVDRELGMLRETVQEASLRQTGGPQQLAFVASVPDDGAVAWQLRDFDHLRYVPVVDQRAVDPVLVTPESFAPETLGARYVGQAVIVQRTFDLASLHWTDLPVWIMYGEARVQPQAQERVLLWVRDDVYGLPPETSDTQP
ncbi:MAG: hypothetical protein Kow0077_05410 [Anaerolineae bacterium]